MSVTSKAGISPAPTTKSAYGRALRVNLQEGTFRFPNGATLEINQLETPGDYSKFHALTGWEPAVDLEEGLEKTVAFYREHREVYWQ